MTATDTTGRDYFCCTGRTLSNGAACDSTCEHETHTDDGRMACNHCGAAIYYDYDADDYRHENADDCFLIQA